MPNSTPFTVTSLVAALDQSLQDAGFKSVEPSVMVPWRATSARVYEDEYSIVCVAVYETWGELSANWLEDQAGLVDLISNHVARSEAKAWEGYLVLVTPSVVPTADRLSAMNIHRDTRYVRKIFADGGQLHLTDDIRQVLLPLLPLEEYDVLEPRDVLKSLLSLLTSHGVNQEVAQVAITAFQQQNPIVANIHEFMISDRAHQP